MALKDNLKLFDLEFFSCGLHMKKAAKYYLNATQHFLVIKINLKIVSYLACSSQVDYNFATWKKIEHIQIISKGSLREIKFHRKNLLYIHIILHIMNRSNFEIFFYCG